MSGAAEFVERGASHEIARVCNKHRRVNALDHKGKAPLSHTNAICTEYMLLNALYTRLVVPTRITYRRTRFSSKDCRSAYFHVLQMMLARIVV